MALIKTLYPVFTNSNFNMNKFLSILFLIIVFGLFNKVKGQTDVLFAQHEIDSLNFNYTPLYSTDSVDFSHLLDLSYLNVYHFNGECSICLNKMSEAETFFNEHKSNLVETVFIVETSDTILFNFYRDELNITTKILWDEKYRLNDKNINTCFLIDKRGKIILEGDFINDKMRQKEYLDLIKELSSVN